MDDRLYRSVDDRVLTGVAGGVAERLDADPSIIRVVWALLSVLSGGLAVIAYIVMAIVVPEDPGLERTGTTRSPVPPIDPGDLDAPTAAFAAATAPETEAGLTRRERRRRRRAARDEDRGPLVGGLILILIGAFFLFRQIVPDIDLGSWWPLILVGIGLILVIVSITPGRRPG